MLTAAYCPGDVIGGKYEVRGELGKGGFGVVYLAFDRESQRLCALKTFKDEFLADAATRASFKREVLLWVKLNEHPFILCARRIDEFSGRLFVQMDYVIPDHLGRVNLADHLAKAGGLLDSSQVLEWAIQFCLGMEHANSHEIKCHRDINPRNILISQGILKIADFGLAAAADVALESSARRGNSLITGNPKDGFGFSMLQTEGKMRCGTPGYMAPEVYRGEPADVQSDIYSFGLVLWQMAAGSTTPPFVGAYRGDIEAYMRETYERQMTGNLSPVAGPLGGVIERCLKPSRSNRFSDFGEVRAGLEPIFLKQTGRTVMTPAVGDQTASFWSNKGLSLAVLGRRDEAIACFDKALAINPRILGAWFGKGNILKALGRREEAIACYDKALAINPRDAHTWTNKGIALSGLAQHEEAIVCYDKALSIDPRDTYAWTSKGGVLSALGRNEEAITCCDKALAIDPRVTYAWASKGDVLSNLGRHGEAIASYDRALAIDPRLAGGWCNKGIALSKLARHEEAIACFDKALAIDPRFALACVKKGLALYKLGRNEEAIACSDKALAIDPRDASAWGIKAVALHELGRNEEAIACFNKAKAIDPRVAGDQPKDAGADRAAKIHVIPADDPTKAPLPCKRPRCDGKLKGVNLSAARAMTEYALAKNPQFRLSVQCLKCGQYSDFTYSEIINLIPETRRPQALEPSLVLALLAGEVPVQDSGEYRFFIGERVLVRVVWQKDTAWAGRLLSEACLAPTLPKDTILGGFIRSQFHLCTTVIVNDEAKPIPFRMPDPGTSDTGVFVVPDNSPDRIIPANLFCSNPSCPHIFNPYYSEAAQMLKELQSTGQALNGVPYAMLACERCGTSRVFDLNSYADLFKI